MREKIIYFYAIAVILGVVTGFVTSCFQISIRLCDHILTHLFSVLGAKGWSVGVISALISMMMALIAWFLVVQFAPEGGGSGVPEIEGALIHQRGIFWKRLLPVKFFGGILAISAKLVLGLEGPAIQMGGNLGAMLAQLFQVPVKKTNALISAGAAAGLAAVFNAPIAGILFILEEMRKQFDFSFIHFKMVAIACVMSTIVMRIMLGNEPSINMPIYQTPDLSALALFFLFGILVGLVAVLFNVSLVKMLVLIERLSLLRRAVYVMGIGLLIGILAYIEPNWVGGGYVIIEQSIKLDPGLSVLVFLFFIRFILTMLCYVTDVPGGIFAPLLALGTLIGIAFFHLIPSTLLDQTTQQGMFAVAGMGGLFAASVRVPITGIVLVVEMTQNYSLILPMMVTCLMATTVVQLVGSKPIYTQLLNLKLVSSAGKD